MKRNVAIFLLGIFILTACGMQTSTLTNIPNPPTDTPTLKSSISPASTIILIKIDTPKPSALPSATITPTKTIVPTFSPEQARRLIDEAQKTNLGCELPCWWGITPGKTSWEATQAFFRALNSKIEHDYYYSPNSYAIGIVDPNTNENMFGLRIFLSEDGLVESMNVPSIYSISELLEKFGEPKEVWFYSGGISAYYMPPSFSIALFYPEYGLLFYDQEEEGEYFRNGNTSIQVCAKHFSLHSYPRLFLWNTDSIKAFEQIKTYIFSNPEDWRFRPLQEVTDMDIPAFVKAFSSPDSEACLLSPADIWPYPLQ